MDQIGEVSIAQMGSIPFIRFTFRGRTVYKNDSTMCSETNSDCFEFINRYLNITWKSNYAIKEREYITNNHKSHVCTPNEITLDHFKTGVLYLCPP